MLSLVIIFSDPLFLDENKKNIRDKRATVCEFCHKSLCDSTEYYRHANNFHKDKIIGWIQCELCDVKLPNEAVIRKHKIRIHPGMFKIHTNFIEFQNNCNLYKKFQVPKIIIPIATVLTLMHYIFK